jgi:protein-disulfide isomerase
VNTLLQMLRSILRNLSVVNTKLPCPAPIILSSRPESQRFSLARSGGIAATTKRIHFLLCLSLLAVPPALTQQPYTTPTAPSSPAQKSVETFLRYYYALGPDVTIVVGAPAELGTSGILEVPVEVKTPEASNQVKMWLTKDGRYLLRGEISDITTDPLAETVAKIQTANAPVLGDPKAPITVVEFSDFECPVCRNLHDALRGLLPNYPQVKVVFEDFPIESVHPWARTAALAGRCAYQQDPKAFWKLYDLIYDNQDLISAANAYNKVLDFATQAGLNTDTLKSCLSSPQTASEVEASLANGIQLEVRSTPTIFVNGRRIVGADPHALQQYLDYEVNQLKSGKPQPKK